MFNLINPKLDKDNKEYLYYHSLLKNLLKKKTSKETEVNETIKILELQFKEYLDQIKELQRTVDLIRQEKNIKFNNQDEDNEIEPPTNMDPPPIKENNNEKLELNIKSLFRRISKKTHPDKTDDLELHELFVLANDAYNKNNYSILLNIYNKLYNNGSFNVDISIQDKLELLKTQFNNEKDAYDAFTKSNTYTINELYKSDNVIHNFRAKQLFSEILFARMVELDTIKKSIE